jgi:hypothetical protein
MSRGPEQHLSLRVRALAEHYRRRFGIWSVKLAGGPYQQPGLPDWLFSVNGRLAAIELKTPDTELSALQRFTAERIVASGALYFTVRKLDDLRVILDWMLALPPAQAAVPRDLLACYFSGLEP